jgi:uncharacterized DUF497 family protein
MIDWARTVGFDWDGGNVDKLAASGRGISQSECEQAFVNEPLIVAADTRHSMTELRFQALGITDAGRRLFIAFTLRGKETLIRVISARDMNRKERNRYEQG